MKKNYFFEPHVGSAYHSGCGPYGKRILVLGSSFYCPYVYDDKACMECTDINKKDSSKYDASCKIYQPLRRVLHDEPSYNIEEKPKAYQNLAKAIGKIIGTTSYDQTWSYLAFTNYVQFFLPATDECYRGTSSADLSPRDFDAFIEVVRKLHPHIIIVCGCIINKPVMNNKYLCDKDMLEQTQGYVCHLDIPGIAHRISVINPFHPSSSAWYTGLSSFQQYLTDELNIFD